MKTEGSVQNILNGGCLKFEKSNRSFIHEVYVSISFRHEFGLFKVHVITYELEPRIISKTIKIERVFQRFEYFNSLKDSIERAKEWIKHPALAYKILPVAESETFEEPNEAEDEKRITRI